MQEAPTPEQELAAYWRKKANITRSDFDALEPIVLTEHRTVEQLKSALAKQIFHGRPLTEAEYYLACAFRYLLADVSYKVFFMNHWHESLEHRAYTSIHDCDFAGTRVERNCEKNRMKGGTHERALYARQTVSDSWRS